MKEFSGRVAVVTGAASGMGLAFAHRFADEGMKVVLADIESEPLAMAEAALQAKGAEAVAVRTNVATVEEIERLADTAFETFGNVHILCNNAGVAAMGGGAVWEVPLEAWDWVLGVNFMGVLHGIRAFVPRMIANGEEGHIVNTASIAGLVTGSAHSYGVSKHGVVCLTEGLFKDFRSRDLPLSASVLCPGWVNTNILDAERNRPAEFGARTDLATLPDEARAFLTAAEEGVKNGIVSDEVARLVFEAIRDDQFYIIPTQPQMWDAVKQRFDDLTNLRNPTIVALE